MAGEHAWQGNMLGRGGGHALQGAWQGACVVGACVAGEMATAAGGTHPTGMHPCFKLCS